MTFLLRPPHTFRQRRRRKEEERGGGERLPLSQEGKVLSLSFSALPPFYFEFSNVKGNGGLALAKFISTVLKVQCVGRLRSSCCSNSLLPLLLLLLFRTLFDDRRWRRWSFEKPLPLLEKKSVSLPRKKIRKSSSKLNLNSMWENSRLGFPWLKNTTAKKLPLQ